MLTVQFREDTRLVMSLRYHWPRALCVLFIVEV